MKRELGVSDEWPARDTPWVITPNLVALAPPPPAPCGTCNYPDSWPSVLRAARRASTCAEAAHAAVMSRNPPQPRAPRVLLVTSDDKFGESGSGLLVPSGPARPGPRLAALLPGDERPSVVSAGTSKAPAANWRSLRFDASARGTVGG
eukprot:scaffold1970_cov396-Prasinococcus_capsulatus_cf.AAC.35